MYEQCAKQLQGKERGVSGGGQTGRLLRGRELAQPGKTNSGHLK